MQAASIPPGAIRCHMANRNPHGYPGHRRQPCRECVCGAYLGAYLGSGPGLTSLLPPQHAGCGRAIYGLYRLLVKFSKNSRSDSSSAAGQSVLTGGTPRS
jgi:hypothetical protein